MEDDTKSARNPISRLTTGRRRFSSPKVLSVMVVEPGTRTQGRFWSCRDPLRTGTIPISPQRFSHRDSFVRKCEMARHQWNP